VLEPPADPEAAVTLDGVRRGLECDTLDDVEQVGRQRR
jgi:hypothetical protein